MALKVQNLENYMIWGTSLFGYLSGLYTKLAVCNLHITTRCNSKCKMCRSWEMEEVDMSLTALENIAKSRCVTSFTDIGLEGGEFLLYPYLPDLMEILRNKRVSIISNGILTDQIIDFVEKYNIHKVSVSLDGNEETQNNIRLDGSYPKVIKTLERLSKYRDSKIISIIYTPYPWNKIEDYQHVMGVADKFGINFSIGLYIDHPIFDPTFYPEDIRYNKDDFTHEFPINNFGRLFPEWLNGNIKLPCISKKSRIAVWPTGDLPLCFSTGLILGNLNQNTLDEIFYKHHTKQLLKKYSDCNRCWLTFHKVIDVDFFLLLKRLFPVKFLQLFWKDLKI